MADVRRDDRAQLMLVSALAIAVLLVGLALTLNTAIYTENLATRSTDTDLGDAVRYGSVVESGAGGLLDEVNREGGDYASLRTDYDTTLGNWSESVATLTAIRGTATEVRAVDHVDGTRISQNDSARNFTNVTGAPADWTLASGAKVRNVRMNVSHGSLSSSTGSAFELALTGAAGDVTAEVYQNSTHVKVTVEDAGGSRATCAVPAGPDDFVTVDVSGRTLNGSRCEPLDAVHTDLSDPVDVEYRNPTAAEGTYELYVNETDTTVDASGNYALDESGSSPVAEEALYSVNVSYVYESGETTVTREIRVAPGEIA